MGTAATVMTVSPPFCAEKVTSDDAAAISTKGTFSRIRWSGESGERGVSILTAASNGKQDGPPLPFDGKRFRGQKSSKSRTHGSVTSIGFDIRPRAKKISASEYRQIEGRSA